MTEMAEMIPEPVADTYEALVERGVKRLEKERSRRARNRFSKFPLINIYRRWMLFLTALVIFIGFFISIGIAFALPLDQMLSLGQGGYNSYGYYDDYSPNSGAWFWLFLMKFFLIIGVYFLTLLVAYTFAAVAEAIKMTLVMEDHLERTANAVERSVAINRRVASSPDSTVRLSGNASHPYQDRVNSDG